MHDAGEMDAKDMRVLVVDLDGTLIRTDMLYETFWSAFSKSWMIPIRSALALRQGRPALKDMLAKEGHVDVAALPYDADVIDLIRAHREEGGRTALVTASDVRLAEAVAEHVGLFDEVHGTRGGENLKGAAKAAFLENRFGARGFDYVGDSEADVDVWGKAATAHTVGASPALRAKAAAAAENATHLEGRAATARDYLRALRPHQWLKNALVFLPMLLAHVLSVGVVVQSVLAFVAFSLVASGVYVLNDLLDLAADRAHPRKRNRPFASGAVPIEHGSMMAVGLLGLGVLISAALGPMFLLVIAIYFVATSAYSLRLKRLMVIDICTLASLYTLRIVAGAAATGIPLSVWLLAFSIFFFFSLAAVKRQAELVDGLASGNRTAFGRGYHVEDLPVVATMSIASGYVSVLVLALYLNSPTILELYSYPAALWGICLILLYWISRVVMITHRGDMHDDPVVFAALDRTSQVCAVVILALAVAGSIV